MKAKCQNHQLIESKTGTQKEAHGLKIEPKIRKKTQQKMTTNK